MERTWIAGLAGVVAAGLLLAVTGCGGKSNISAPATSTTAHTTKAATPTNKAKTTAPKTATKPKTYPAQTAPATTATKPKTRPTQTAPATTTKKGPELALSDCRKLARLSRRMGQAFSGHTPAADAKAYADFLHQLADRGPAEFRGDFAVMADAYGKIASALATVYTSPTARPTEKQQAQLTEVVKTINTGTLTQAAGEINTWLAQAC